MEFSWLNKQGVASTQGFEVQVINRECIEYREQGKTISVGYEMGMNGGKPCVLMSPKSFVRWDDTTADNTMSSEDQSRIEANFRRAMAFQGVNVVVESPGDT